MIAQRLERRLFQRLVRLVCDSCAEPYEPTPDELTRLGAASGNRDGGPEEFRRGGGCDECAGTGGENFMFWGAGELLQETISPQQAELLDGSPPAK